MPVLCLLFLISRNSPKQLGMVSPELRPMIASWGDLIHYIIVVDGWGETR